MNELTLSLNTGMLAERNWASYLTPTASVMMAGGNNKPGKINDN
ncbi:hypothetical protein yfred0001_17200 [Yersinia frederiksenii ATCC 33641]|nr:hypothetical protein yfred0001_17200 [Yersinia frederiksenii ATCC 33641]